MAPRFQTIVIDPPWPGPGEVPAFDSRAATDPIGLRLIPYATMTGVQVAALRIDQIASVSAQIFIWCTSRSVGDAFLLTQLWAFKFRGLFVWEKPLGLGRHVRAEAEFLLWAGRRGAPLVEPQNCPRQIQRWPKPRRHSEKPAEAYAMIRSLSRPPRLDVFARQRRPGFRAFGNQLDSASAEASGKSAG